MKQPIKVNLLFLSGHHIEILLEKPEGRETSYYTINRWEAPAKEFCVNDNSVLNEIEDNNDIYSFTIEADPEEIIKEWTAFYEETLPREHILKENCADASQWFLKKFCDIDKPRFWGPVYTNDQITPSFDLSQLLPERAWAQGIQLPAVYLPSALPLPFSIPRRVFENARMHLEIRNHPEQFIKQSWLWLSIKLAANALMMIGNVVGMVIASAFLTAGMNFFVLIPLIGFFATTTAPRFFKTVSECVAKGMAEKVIAARDAPPAPPEAEEAQPPGGLGFGAAAF